MQHQNANATLESEGSIMIKQEPEWMSSYRADIPSEEELRKWMKMSERKEVILDEYEFCEMKFLKTKA